MKGNNKSVASFDAYAQSYDSDLNRGISLSGEDKEYFARARIAVLSSCLHSLAERPRSVLDFGCGTGTGSKFLLDLIKPERLIGVDISAASLEVARISCPSKRAWFFPTVEYQSAGDIELAYCSGVFHHIPVDQRSFVLKYIYNTLKPGGIFSFWENNPFNPGTRLIMSRIPFDKDASPLTAPAVRRLMSKSGFQILRTDYHFIFPKILSCCRSMEPFLAKLPIGAQYQVLSRKQF
jgi:SAM-dependent methyltransferase